jgi:hypothetical protein
LQVPSDPVSAHERQVPVHAVWQHTDCEQLPELQSVLAVHVDPLGRRPHVPFVPGFMQVLGEVQSVLAAHVVLHTPFVASHANGVHSDEVTVLQAPTPSQVRVGVNVDPTQVEAAQVVPLGYSWHAPLPLQTPLVPQLEAPWSMHWFSGSCPTGMFVQVPSVAASAHDVQVPVQLELQQTPCWHDPEAHSVPAPQARPSGFLVQVPPLQTFGARQSVSAVQVTLQTLFVVSHRKFPQVDMVAAAHVPAPSQVRGDVNVDPVQLPATHWVPLT